MAKEEEKIVEEKEDKEPIKEVKQREPVKKRKATVKKEFKKKYRILGIVGKEIVLSSEDGKGSRIPISKEYENVNIGNIIEL